MRRHIVNFWRGGAALALLGTLSSGCHTAETASDPAASPQSLVSHPVQTTQAIQAIQNDPKLPPPVKAQLMNQMQNPGGRPAGAPPAPVAH